MLLEAKAYETCDIIWVQNSSRRQIRNAWRWRSLSVGLCAHTGAGLLLEEY